MLKTRSEPKRRKLLIIQRTQYGYLTDTYKISGYLESEFDIQFICLDAGLPRYPNGAASVKYICRGGFWGLGLMRLIKVAINEVKSTPSSVVFIVYFPFSSLVRLITGRNAIVDIRTASVHWSLLARCITDFVRRIEVGLFDKITVVSKGVRARLRLPKQRTHLLPLGADTQSYTMKVFDYPRLLYIGTLNNRQLEDTIQGVAEFLKSNPKYRTKLSYDIVGDGAMPSVDRIKRMIRDCKLEGVVNFHGYLKHCEAQYFFDNCNVGVSYIPLTAYYDHQPPTKTYEYVLSGMPVLATPTSEHKRIISNANGVFCENTAASFSDALSELVKRFKSYDDKVIRRTLKDCSWINVADEFKAIVLADK